MRRYRQTSMSNQNISKKPDRGRIYEVAFGVTGEDLAAMSDEELERVNAKAAFVRSAMPDAWFDHATELKESAEFLWPQMSEGMRVEAQFIQENAQSGMALTEDLKQYPRVSRPYVLLASFAVENLLKGLLVAQNPSYINSGKLSKDLKSHNLLALAGKVKGLSLSAKERQICEILQVALSYWGRYPIPLSHEGLLPELPVNHEFRQVFLRLFDKLGTKVYRLFHNGWDSGVGPTLTWCSHKAYDDKDITHRKSR